MAADLGLDPGRKCSPADHSPHIGLEQGIEGQLAGAPSRCPEEKPFPVLSDAASYLGLVPREHSSGGKQRMGGISKQGNRLLRFLLVEAANIAVRFDPALRKEYLHRCHQKHFTVAKVATARKLAVRMYWMLRTQTPYPQVLSSRVA